MSATARTATLASLLLTLPACASAPGLATSTEPTIASRTSLPRARPPLGVPTTHGELSTTIGQGEDAARAALFALLDAFVAGDVETMRRLIGEAPITAHALRHGRNVPDEFVLGRRETFVQRLLAAHRAARLPEGFVLRDVIDPADVDVTPAHEWFPDGVPGGLERSDLLVRFAVDDAGARALAALATEGRGLIVVRIGTAGAEVVGF